MIFTKGCATESLIKWNMSVGKLLGPNALFELRSLILFITSTILVGFIKKNCEDYCFPEKSRNLSRNNGFCFEVHWRLMKNSY